MKSISEVACPDCGHITEFPVAEGEVVPWYRCEGCRVIVKTPLNCCCILCTYGNTPCFSGQRGAGC